MAGLIRADPARLEEYHADTAPALARARDAVEAYREALAAFHAAEPNDLRSHLDDRSATITGALQDLAVLDELPAAFGAALRQLDASFDPGDPRPQVLTVDDPLAWWNATAAHLRDIDQERNRLGRLGEWFAELPEAVELVIEDVTTTARRTVIILEERAWRRALLTVDELQHVVRRWSVSLDLTALRRAAPHLKKLGAFGDAATGAFATWDQWQADAPRPDLTTTERVIRAGLDGVARGLAQATISAGSAVLAAPLVAAAPVTGGLSLIGAGAVLAAGVVVGEKADPLVGQVLDGFYESQSGGIQIAADAVDAAGGQMSDASKAAQETGSEVLSQFNDWLHHVASPPWSPSPPPWSQR